LPQCRLSSYGIGYAQFYAMLIMVLLAVLGVLMVSTLKYTSFKTAGTGRRNLYLVLVIAAVGMLIWLYSKYVLVTISGLYVAHGVFWYLLSLIRRRAPHHDSPGHETGEA
jgi:CDP-diacylglycerol---serine O-phosphatidyltransferase